jgi:hypothetical protein
MTALFGGLQYGWLDMQAHERSKKPEALSGASHIDRNREHYGAEPKSLSRAERRDLRFLSAATCRFALLC